MISARLKNIANLINEAELVVDVGSDHAQLSILLISNNKANKVINIEKNKEPYLASVKNTYKYNKIENLLSDGFIEFDPTIKIDYVTIAGMGAKSMIDILLPAKNEISNLILCPNNNEQLIRKFALKNKYKIKKDLVVLENNIYYPIIWLSKNEGFNLSESFKDLILGIHETKEYNKTYFDYLNYKINTLNKIKDIKIHNLEKYNELLLYLEEIKKWQ